MESIILLSLIAAGYYLSKNNDEKKINKKFIPNINNEEITFDDVNEYELNKNTENINKVKNGNTNIIPPHNNDKIFNENDEELENFENDKKIFSSLTGTSMNEEEFKHNNMVPFFKGATAPGNNYKNNDQLLERFIGDKPYDLEKKEREPLFAPEKDQTNIYGYTKDLDDMKTRINVSNIRTSETPFEKIQVGPGLNNGYTSKGSDGFHPDTRDYALPKSVDELRVLTNPKVQYKGKIIKGKAINDLRGVDGETRKYRPDTFYVNTPDRWNTTVGAYTKETKRPCVIVKDTNRKKSRTFFGPAISDYERHKLKPKFKKSTKNIFVKDWVRNAFADNKWGNYNSETGDYGKNSYNLPCNERDVTTNRTHTLNAQSVVKAIIAPLLDEMKKTRKENVIGNIRECGNVQITGPTNLTVYDPNDVARTTMKETNIDNKHTGYVGNLENGDAYLVTENNAPNTNRQFQNTKHFGNTGNVQDGDGYLVADKNAPNTNRQFQNTKYFGNTGNVQNGDAYLVTEKNAPNTNRQFTENRRKPTQVKEMLMAGSDKVEIDIKKKESDYINQIPPKVDKIYNSIPEKNECEFTNQKDQLDNDKLSNRLNSCMVDAFNKNPYTQSLSSYAYS